MRYFLFTKDGRIWFRRTADGIVDPFFAGPFPDALCERVEGDIGVAETEHPADATAEGVHLRAFFQQVPRAVYHLAERASELLFWRATHRYCGVCGAELTRDEKERAMKCPACGSLFFPRINPAVITLVTRGDSVLLERKTGAALPFWSLVAGFVEAGETLEEAAAREIREETGISVCNLRYRCSQPWPFPNSLMAGFRAEYVEGDVCPDGVEIDQAQWFPRGALPSELPRKMSIAYFLLDEWLKEKS